MRARIVDRWCRLNVNKTEREEREKLETKRKRERMHGCLRFYLVYDASI